MIDPTQANPETRALADDVRRILDELDAQAGSRPLAGECTPDVDVLETAQAFEIVVDVPGVALGSLRIMIKRDILLVAGRKPPTGRVLEGATFHRAERRFGRFARAVRLSAAFDGRRARAALTAGELRIVVPKIDDRRGTEILVPIE